MQSPDFIIPGNGAFNKVETIKTLNASLEKVKESTKDIDVSELLVDYLLVR